LHVSWQLASVFLFVEYLPEDDCTKKAETCTRLNVVSNYCAGVGMDVVKLYYSMALDNIEQKFSLNYGRTATVFN